MASRIHLDLDGVLADCIGAALHRLGRHDFAWPPGVRDLHEALGCSRDAVWSRLADHRFWATLPKTAEFDEIVRTAEDLAGRENVYVLSAPTESVYSASGKLAWLWDHLPDYVEQGRYVLTRSKRVCARSGDVLVDDSPKNVASWEASGGIGILVPRPWNYRHRESASAAIAELRDAARVMSPCRAKTWTGSTGTTGT